MDPIVAAFDRQVGRDPGRALVVGPNDRATRGDVDALARAAARALAEAALPEYGPAGVIASNGSGFLAAFVACLRSRAPAVLLDPGMTERETQSVASRFGLAAVLRVSADEPRGSGDFHVERRSGVIPEGSVRGSVVKLTSGSSGEPRGVVTSSLALMADDEALRATMSITEQDRLVAMIPFSHSYGLSSLVIPALVAGIPLLVPARGSPFEALRVAAGAGGTVLPTVPAWVAALLRLSELPPWPPALATVVTAGAPLLPATAAGFRARFGLPIHVFYGASECGGISYDRDGGAGERGTVGEPVAGARVELLSSHAGDGAGRIAVHSDAVASSYFPDTDGSLADGRFVSQDLAVREGSELRLVGRLDQIVKIRGRKVHPHEIEQVIAEMGSVDDVIVDAVTDSDHGEPLMRAIVASVSAGLAPDQVIAWCRGRLSDHKVPRRVLIVRAIPRTARAKLDRVALESMHPSIVAGPRGDA